MPDNSALVLIISFVIIAMIVGAPFVAWVLWLSRQPPADQKFIARHMPSFGTFLPLFLILALAAGVTMYVCGIVNQAERIVKVEHADRKR
jgi:hypothetical protein